MSFDGYVVAVGQGNGWETGNGVWCQQSEEFMTKTGTCRRVGVERIIPSRADRREGERERTALLWPTTHREIAD